jgi:hypothetical protein
LPGPPRPPRIFASGASQGRIAAQVEGLGKSRVSKVKNDRERIVTTNLIERIADGLRIPGEHFRLARRPWETATAPFAEHPAPTRAPRTWTERPDAAGQPSANSTPTAPGLEYGPSIRHTLATVDALGRSDVRRRDVLLRSPFVLGALAAPSRDWLLASLDAADAGRPRRADMAAVDSIRAMFGIFQEMDVIQGGGDIARRAVAAYLTDHVLPLLGESHPDRVRRALFEVAAEQTYLAGWMAFDCGLHGLAQRYLTQALHLAETSGDRVLGSHVLAGMCDQATQLGHPSEGLQLARAGRHGLKGLRAPAATADLYVLEARALAALGRSAETAAAIGNAERSFARVQPDAEPEWARFIDEPYLTGEIANSLRDVGDPREAIRHARRSVAAAKAQKRGRRGALSQTVVAVGFLQQNDLEAAVAAGHAAVDIAAGVPTSARYAAAVADLRTRLVPFQREPAARGLVARLDRTVPAL